MARRTIHIKRLIVEVQLLVLKFPGLLGTNTLENTNSRK